MTVWMNKSWRYLFCFVGVINGNLCFKKIERVKWLCEDENMKLGKKAVTGKFDLLFINILPAAFC